MPLLLERDNGLQIGLAAETGLESCESGESRRGSSKATRKSATPSRSCVTMCRAKALVTCRLASFTLPGSIAYARVLAHRARPDGAVRFLDRPNGAPRFSSSPTVATREFHAAGYKT